MTPDKIKFVAGRALSSIDSVLSRWLPGGKREGQEYLPLNPKRADRSPGSLSINLKTAKWAEFSSGDKGADLVSLRLTRMIAAKAKPPNGWRNF